ncbi:hypothetical protein DNTS_005134 [Danionella cerebrum]|uniref:Uncharacterized protein n=1 Tax=Danionella cerebrum TaxID=2873325 RepID=A0A553R3P9_9TELE|nr:hypothetical protein DNTS_005134 [Danionella translucida]
MHLKLLVIAASLCFLKTEAHSGRFPLPERRSSADYFTKCDLPSSCDWTLEGTISTQSAADELPHVSRLKSRPLDISEDSCLEFWYHKPQQKSNEFKVLLVDDILKTLIWTSEDSSDGDWRQVYVPLTKLSDKVQVVFERSQDEDEKTVFDRIGIRKGQCGPQCQPGDYWTDDNTRCVCNNDQLVCSHVPWSSDTFGTCLVASEPYYTTFDGVTFQFETPCTYILSKVCDDPGSLPEFAVEVHNEKNWDSYTSSIQQVDINVHGLTVSLMRTERNRVMVNGVWRHLPFLQKGNRVKVHFQANALALQTDFNLSVFYEQSGAVQVIIPIQYSNRLCGMCGNFNQEPEDDFKIPRGTLSPYSLSGGQGVCDEPSLPRVCSEAEDQTYASELYCGLITSRKGPFATCSSVLNTDGFFRRCMFDMCITQGDPAALCNAIEDFSSTCEKVGLSGPVWRNSTFCPVECGPNSHFNVCANGCLQTCSSQDITGHCGRCEEGCQCDEGFLLSGGECVLEEDCGCWVNGEHYSECQCLGNGSVQCSPVSCAADELCLVKDGVKGCFPSSPVTCRVYGDPHYISFDGKAYSFWGTCNYTIAQSCGPTNTQFTISARNQGRTNSASSSLNSVALHMQGLHIVMGRNKPIQVNGAQVRLPAAFGSSVSISLAQSGPYVQIDTNFGLRLLFGNARLFVQVDERHRGSICGLCGTYSGSQFDDFTKPDGNTVANAHEFAVSWKNYDSHWPCSDGSPEPPACPPELEDDAYVKCSQLFEDAFKECHWFVPPQIYVSSCVSDYCLSNGDRTQLCTSLEDYVSACEIAEVFLPDWRNQTLCFVTSPSAPPTNVPTTTKSSGSCTWSCNFDQDECGWEQLIQDSFDWTRWPGSTPSTFTGPSSDHTTGSGYYMYIEGDSVVHGDSARLMTPVCHSTGQQCLSFWFHMYGSAFYMFLNIYIFEGNRATKIWSSSNNHGDRWILGHAEIKPQHPFQIIIEGIRGSDPRSDVAIDDVAITYGSCDSLSAEDSTSTALVPLPTTQNSIHPHPSGFYMYIEGDSAVHGDTARLLSSKCSNLLPQCLELWYHMYGSSGTMGLSVYMQYGNVGKEVWSTREDQGNKWHLARVDLRPEAKFQVIIEGIRGSSALSDVAIDDVSLHAGACRDLPNQVIPPEQTPKPNLIQSAEVIFEGRIGNSAQSDVAIDDISLHQGPCSNLPEQMVLPPVFLPLPKSAPEPGSIQAAEVPNTSASCSIGCDFEKDICSWTQLPTDVFDWTRHRGSTPTPKTGPSSDHTTGSGFYMYIEGDTAVHGDTARLLSSDCADPRPQCLQFWYHMYGSSWTMGLTVYILQHGNVATEVWRKREDQGNVWHLAQVDLRPEAKFQVIFEGRIGSSALSDVAIDDISLHTGPCAINR